MKQESKAVGLYSHIRNNNITSALLLLMFPLSVLFIIWLIGFGWELYFRYLESQGTHMPIAVHRSASLMAAGMMAVIDYGLYAMVISFVWVGIAAGFHENLINMATGSKTVERNEYPELYNLLENLCISRGIKTPKLGIIKSDALNAFASGVSEKSYRVVVTKGLLETLDKNELEAVLAHELTHIMNKDVRMMVIATVFVGMISFISEMLWRSMRSVKFRSSSRKSGKNGAGALILIAAVALAIGYVFAILVRFSLSRTREYLADAGAVELTKNPGALASALRKISGNAKLENVPDEVRQMFIENPPAFTGLFSTHPPVEERIRILESMGEQYSPGQSFIEGRNNQANISTFMTSNDESDSLGITSNSDSPWSIGDSGDSESFFESNKHKPFRADSSDQVAFRDSVDSNDPDFAPPQSFFKSPWLLIAILMLALGGGLLFVSFSSWHEESAYAANGRLASGRVENLWTSSNSNKSTDYYVKYGFSDLNNVKRIGTSKVGRGAWSKLRRGGDIMVQYLPMEDKSRVQGTGFGKWGALGLGGAGLILLIGAIYMPHNFQQRQDLYNNLKIKGTQVVGRINKIDDSSVTINNKPYTKIEYEFTDIRGNKYRGKTRYLKLSLANDFKIGAKIDVFYDSKNPKKNISEIG